MNMQSGRDNVLALSSVTMDMKNPAIFFNTPYIYLNCIAKTSMMYCE